MKPASFRFLADSLIPFIIKMQSAALLIKQNRIRKKLNFHFSSKLRGFKDLF